MVWDLFCLEYLEEKDHLISESVIDKGACRTDPDKPGLIMTIFY